jgi:hypothetical protein
MVLPPPAPLRGVGWLATFTGTGGAGVGETEGGGRGAGAGAGEGEELGVFATTVSPVRAPGVERKDVIAQTTTATSAAPPAAMTRTFRRGAFVGSVDGA